jgi:hypothetical protein
MCMDALSEIRLYSVLFAVPALLVTAGGGRNVSRRVNPS